MINKNTINRLAIVGNGLDLHHGVKSSFEQFFNSDDISYSLKKKYIDETKAYHIGKNWYDFEEEYRVLINNEIDSYEYGITDDDKKELFPKVNNINDIFQGLNYEFLKYLQKEYNVAKSNSSFKIDEIVQKKLKEVDIILTFNYTNTLVDLYGINPKKIIHVHGDLDNGAILGHSNFCGYDIETDKAENYALKMFAPEMRENAYKGDKTLQRIESWNNLEHSSGYFHNAEIVSERLLLKRVLNNSMFSYNMLEYMYENPFLEFKDVSNNKNFKNKLCLNFSKYIDVIIIGHSIHSDIDLLSKIPANVKYLSVFQRSDRNEKLDNRAKKVFAPKHTIFDFYEWD